LRKGIELPGRSSSGKAACIARLNPPYSLLSEGISCTFDD